MELDRIAEEFKKLHAERQDLVSRWQVKNKILSYGISGNSVVFHEGLQVFIIPFSLFFLLAFKFFIVHIPSIMHSESSIY
jgi:uncharacterized membrane-anchored protein YitT (DUF2179 family)